ncbi:nsfl1 cofactor p47 [Lichtheimia corymbifera JMRC:FSU:9682]|uniref:Nsfl1 cofactor p47 n=1 Tax=Lichtheimia corymbifera JMRC:FSU:9682 TaxID=1263082 RepID=A0A068RTP5_9FUNG|nr:nsfl1 cofactor p47 [Lichtheimia corymbifera JMRC:FSU:9682]
MANRDELTQQFINTTGSTSEQAQFFLEMAGWDVKVAIDQFYEFGNQDNSPAAGNDTTTGDLTGSSSNAPASSSLAPPTTSKSSSSSAGRSKVRTLSDLGDGDHDEESDDDRHQNFFAGGERSGMVVQGPNKQNDVVNQILKKAAEGGAAPEEADVGGSSKPKYFKGTGYKLGSEEDPSEVIATDQPDESETELEPVTRYLTFWRNGFSVDDGPLFRYDDPANQTMLAAINSGRAPLSLLNVRHGQPVDVRVARKQDEDYVPPPKAPPKPFEGAGHRLGSPVPLSESSRSSTPGTFPASSSSTASTEQPVTVDESQPTTQLQIRLGDGSRLVAKFNQTHTIGDIRRYIDANRPSDRSYILQTSFPVKELTDSEATLKDSGLLNSVVLQRYQ